MKFVVRVDRVAALRAGVEPWPEHRVVDVPVEVLSERQRHWLADNLHRRLVVEAPTVEGFIAAVDARIAEDDGRVSAHLGPTAVARRTIDDHIDHIDDGDHDDDAIGGDDKWLVRDRFERAARDWIMNHGSFRTQALMLDDEPLWLVSAAHDFMGDVFPGWRRVTGGDVIDDWLVPAAGAVRRRREIKEFVDGLDDVPPFVRLGEPFLVLLNGDPVVCMQVDVVGVFGRVERVDTFAVSV